MFVIVLPTIVVSWKSMKIAPWEDIFLIVTMHNGLCAEGTRRYADTAV